MAYRIRTALPHLALLTVEVWPDDWVFIKRVFAESVALPMTDPVCRVLQVELQGLAEELHKFVDAKKGLE